MGFILLSSLGVSLLLLFFVCFYFICFSVLFLFVFRVSGGKEVLKSVEQFLIKVDFFSL